MGPSNLTPCSYLLKQPSAATAGGPSGALFRFGDMYRPYVSSTTPTLRGDRYVQDWSAQDFVRDVWGRFEPCTSAQTNPNPNPNPIPNLNPISNPSGRLRSRHGQSRGSAARLFAGFFIKKNSGRSIGQPRPVQKPHSARKVKCRLILHICY